MKSFVGSTLIAGILAIVVNTALVAQTSSSGFDQWYRAKYGRPSPAEQSRLKSPVVDAVSPEAAPPTAAVSANAGFEQWYLAKYGRPSPTEQARLNAPRVNAVFPEVTQPAVAVSVNEQRDPATTPAEHERVAKFYQAQAQDYLAQAKEHTAMVAAYRTNPNINAKNQAATINHCEYFAAKFTAMATKSQELAEMHEQMATDAGKK